MKRLMSVILSVSCPRSGRKLRDCESETAQPPSGGKDVKHGALVVHGLLYAVDVPNTDHQPHHRAPGRSANSAHHRAPGLTVTSPVGSAPGDFTSSIWERSQQDVLDVRVCPRRRAFSCLWMTGATSTEGAGGSIVFFRMSDRHHHGRDSSSVERSLQSVQRFLNNLEP